MFFLWHEVWLSDYCWQSRTCGISEMTFMLNSCLFTWKLLAFLERLFPLLMGGGDVLDLNCTLHTFFSFLRNMTELLKKIEFLKTVRELIFQYIKNGPIHFTACQTAEEKVQLWNKVAALQWSGGWTVVSLCTHTWSWRTHRAERLLFHTD